MPEEQGFIEKGKTKVNELIQKVIPIPSPDMDVHKNISKSTHKKSGQKVLVADLKIEGNPLLVTNEVVTITNVAKRHAGNWIAEKVVHDITAGGTYTTTVSLTKNGTNKATNSSGNKSKKVNTTKGDTNPKAKKKIPIIYVDTNGNGKERKVYK